MVSKVTKDQEPIPYQALLDENNALKDEIQSLRARLEEPEELQRAIREGDLDALVMPVSEEDLVVFTLNGADQAYRTLMETANEDMVIVDDKFKVTYAGKRLLDKTGYSQEEVIGRPLLQFIDREYKTFVKQRMEERRKGVSDSYESKLISRDGSPYWVIVSAKPLFDNDGNFTGTLAMLTDITERKQAEEALHKAHEELQIKSEELQASYEELQVQSEELQVQTEELEEAYASLGESEKRYRLLFTNMTEGFLLGEVICDRGGRPYDYRHLEINPAYESETGVRKERVLGKSLLEVFPNANPLQKEKFFEVVFSGRSTSFEIFSQVADKYFEVYAFSPEKGRFAAIFRNITERKKAEEALQESEEKYRNIVETANEGIWIVGPEARTTYVNKKMAEMLGYTQEEMIGKSGLDFTDEEGREISRRNMEERERGIDASHEFKLIRKDGTPLWAFVNAKSLFDKSGKFIGSMSMLTDITRRREIETRLKETLDNLEEKVKERTEKLEKAYKYLRKVETVRKQEIHHRIKNNLQVISSLLDLQAEKFRGKKNVSDSQILEAFQESQDRVISMALIHEELHKGGKLDTLNISHYIEKLANNLLLTYGVCNNGISLDMDIEENIFFDMDISVPLGIIINELISNSLKHAFSDRDKGKIQIKLKREKNGEYESEDCNPTYVLSVSDNGIGIPKDLDIKDIDSLGLQLVTSLVDQLDGELELKRNNGTEFIVRFTVKER